MTIENKIFLPSTLRRDVKSMIKEKGIELKKIVSCGTQEEDGELKSVFVILKTVKQNVDDVFEKAQFKQPPGNVLFLRSIYIEDGFENIRPILNQMLYGINLNHSFVFTILKESSPFFDTFSDLNFNHRGIRFQETESNDSSLLMIYGMTEVIDQTTFGIEFEICVCENFDEDILSQIEGGEHFIGPGNLIANFQRYAKMLNYLSKISNLSSEFIPRKYSEYNDISPEELYKTYFITSDSSIRCADPLNLFTNEIYKKKDTFTADNCKLIPMELVTPKLEWKKDSLQNFLQTLDNVILDKNFLYESNQSQGMHINVGHPLVITDEGKEKFLKLWWYFEPLIFYFIPEYRRNSRYAKALRKTFRSLEMLVKTWRNIYADPDEPEGKYNAICVKSNRIEFRIVPSGMGREHILNWLNFCVLLINASIDKPIPCETLDFVKQFDLLFDTFIEDKTLKTYFLKRTKEYFRLVTVDDLLFSRVLNFREEDYETLSIEMLETIYNFLLDPSKPD